MKFFLSYSEFLDAELLDPFEQLTSINLAENKLTTISAEVYKKWSAIFRLELSFNPMGDFLSAEIFEDLATLTILGMAGMEIRELPSGLLQPLANLQEIALDYNSIRRLNSNAFGYNSKMKSDSIIRA